MAKATEQATMTVTTTVASDPVFAAIDAHRVADPDSNAINDECRLAILEMAARQHPRPGSFRRTGSSRLVQADRA